MTVATVARVCEALDEVAEFTSPGIRAILATDDDGDFSEELIVTAVGDEAMDERFVGENVVYLDDVRIQLTLAGQVATEMDLAL